MNIKAQVYIAMALLHGAIASVVPTSSIQTSSQTASDHVSNYDVEADLHSKILIARQNYDNSESSNTVHPKQKSNGFNFMGFMPSGMKMPGMPKSSGMKMPGMPKSSGMKMPAMPMTGGMKMPSIPMATPAGFPMPVVPFTESKTSDTPSAAAKYPNMRYWKA